MVIHFGLCYVLPCDCQCTYQVMALCALNNAWSQPVGSKFMVEWASGDSMLDALLRFVKDERPDLRQMSSAFLANLSLSVEVRSNHLLPSLSKRGQFLLT